MKNENLECLIRKIDQVIGELDSLIRGVADDQVKESEQPTSNYYNVQHSERNRRYRLAGQKLLETYSNMSDEYKKTFHYGEFEHKFKFYNKHGLQPSFLIMEVQAFDQVNSFIKELEKSERRAANGQ